MAVHEYDDETTTSSQKLVDLVPTSLTARQDTAYPAADESVSSCGEPTSTKKKTRRSRRGGYRRKRQQQKKIAALLPATSHLDVSKSLSCDNSTVTTESESSSCDSSTASDIPPNNNIYRKSSNDNNCNIQTPPSTTTCVRRRANILETSNSSRDSNNSPASGNTMNCNQYVHVPAWAPPPHHPYQFPTYNNTNNNGYWNEVSSESSVSEMSHSDAITHSSNSRNSPPPVVEAVSLMMTEAPLQLTRQQQDQYIALDCEMVGVGPEGIYSALARVTIIDWNGKVLMDEFVKPGQKVTDYRTFVSGITPEILNNATMDFCTCRKRVMKLLRGKILVGHALTNDLQVLRISHPWYMTRDTAKYEPFMKVRFIQDGLLWPRSLKDLAREMLNRDVQVYGRPHCSYEDALAALDLYRLVWQPWEQSMEYKRNRTWAIQQHQKQQRRITNKHYASVR